MRKRGKERRKRVEKSEWKKRGECMEYFGERRKSKREKQVRGKEENTEKSGVYFESVNKVVSVDNWCIS